MDIYKAYCRVYQAAFKIGMYMVPWIMPETLEGAGSVKKLPAVIREHGYKKVMIVTDKVLNQEFHLLDGLYEAMDKCGVGYVVFDGVKPNPTDLNIAEGASLVRKRKRIDQLQGVFKVLRKIPMIYVVPTTAGTGSETTIAAVITDSGTRHKASMNDPFLMPRSAVIDPELTREMPPELTATTGMDALCHAVESYSNNTYNTRLEKKYSEDAVRLIYDNLYTCYVDGENLEARQNMQKAAFYAGRSFTRGCVGYVHAIGHTLADFMMCLTDLQCLSSCLM